MTESHNLSEADWQYMQAEWGAVDREAANTIWLEAQAKNEKKAEELFGAGTLPPEDESEIIFSDLPHGDKVAQLHTLRAEKLSKDRVHARGLGIRLD